MLAGDTRTGTALLRPAVAAIFACRAACSRLATRRKGAVGQPAELGRTPVVGPGGIDTLRRRSIAVSTALRQSAGTDPVVTTPRTSVSRTGLRGQNRAFCGAPSEVTHSLWTAVEINYNCATGLTALKASPCWHPHWRVRDAGRIPAPDYR